MTPYVCGMKILSPNLWEEMVECLEYLEKAILLYLIQEY